MYNIPMTKTKSALALTIATITIIAFFLWKKQIPQAEIHYHAGIVVFENNKKLDFSDTKYMYTKPCLVGGGEDTKNVNVQMEKAHLHDNVGDVVHVEAQGATWQDLFTNIRYPINYSKTTGYINAQKIPNFQQTSIQPFQSLVVFIGENDPKFLSAGVTKEYIETKSKESKGCGE